MKPFYGYKNLPEIFLNQEKLFSAIFSLDITAKTKVRSPIRYGDNRAGCKFKKMNGIMYFLDFTQAPPAFNIIKFYSALKKISLLKAEIELYNIIDGKNKNFKLTNDYSVNLRNKKNQGKTRAIYSVRKWNESDKKYWNQYGISIKSLDADGTKPITAIKFYDDLKDLVNISYYKPAYLIQIVKIDGIVKAYCPLGKKEIKWFTNSNNNHIGNLDNYSKKENYVIIEKSYKDSKILNNYKINNVYFQNEGQIPSNEILIKHFGKLEIILIIFDNDGPGQDAAIKVKKDFRKLFRNIPIIEILERTDYRYSDIADERSANKKRFKNTIIFLRKSIKFMKNYVKIKGN